MKIRCRILDNLKANGVLRLAGSEHALELSEADIEVLTEQGVIELLDTDDNVMLLGSNTQPSMLYTLQGARVPLGDVVRAAWRSTLLPSAGWNALPDEQREAAIEQAVWRMNLRNQPPSAFQDAVNDPVSGFEYNEREGGTRQGTGAAVSLPATASSNGDALSNEAPAAVESTELPPTGGEAKPATINVAIDAPGGNAGSAAASGPAPAAAQAAKPPRKGK